MLQITQATPADLRDIQAMVKALTVYHGDTASASLGWLQTIFFDTPNSGAAFIARSNGAAVGYAGVIQRACIHDGTYRFDIQHLYIAESHRAQGLGRALIAAAKAYARGFGAKGMTIGTDPDNKSAQAAYRAMGLEELTGNGPRFWIEMD